MRANTIRVMVKQLVHHRSPINSLMGWGHQITDEVANGLGLLGVVNGRAVFVHSRFSSLGFFPGGPAAFIQLLRDLVGPTGLISMPSFPFDGTMKEYVEGQPTFDVNATPSLSGLLTEEFRRTPGVVRSLHPTHPVCAIGAGAGELVRGHEMAGSPCGMGTPFAKLARLDAMLLRIGTGALTLFHHVQEMSSHPNLFLPEPATLPCVDANGRNVEVTTRVYRPLIPNILFLDPAPEDGPHGTPRAIHPSNYPLLYWGDREDNLASRPGSASLVSELRAERERFQRHGWSRPLQIGNAKSESFSIREYLREAVPRFRDLNERHRELYALERLTALHASGGYP